MEISFGDLGSSLPGLEEEGLEGGVSPWMSHHRGGREEARLPGRNQELRV